ncbi:MAG: endonuclease domain-containing protein [Anaerolineae bacterium]|nr:endonuclease domain-containing protein [Anaerolineae bacterium]
MPELEEPTKHIPPTILARARELRRQMTPAEQKLWQQLRGRQFYQLKFRRQHPLARFILDFYCHQHQLVIEVDGDSHADPAQKAYDAARTEWLEQRGLRVIRFSNYDIETNMDGVLTIIAQHCGIEIG